MTSFSPPVYNEEMARYVVATDSQYKNSSETFSYEDFNQIFWSIWNDTTDLPNVGIVYLPDSQESEIVLIKADTAVMQTMLDGAIFYFGELKHPDEVSFDIRLVIGDVTYMIDTTLGYFSKEKCGEVVSSRLDEHWLDLLHFRLRILR